MDLGYSGAGLSAVSLRPAESDGLTVECVGNGEERDGMVAYTERVARSAKSNKCEKAPLID